MFANILMLIAQSAGTANTGMTGRRGQMRETKTAELRFNEGKQLSSDAARRAIPGFLTQEHASWATLVAPAAPKWDNRKHGHRHPENVDLILGPTEAKIDLALSVVLF
jgi:hypothetical protein